MSAPWRTGITPHSRRPHWSAYPETDARVVKVYRPDVLQTDSTLGDPGLTYGILCHCWPQTIRNLSEMTPHIDNPYAPTMDVNERTKHRPSRGSHAFAAVATVGALAYITFTVILFFSGPGDLIAGLMFLVNTPVFIGLAVSAFRSTRVSVYFAIGAAVVQMAITIAMLVMQYGDSLTVTGIIRQLSCRALQLRCGLGGQIVAI